ncbi:hypothetical protein [Alkalihalobacterium alkalinitrilicum]|uniref:hypothetical protein n=1 Tax=Alkalihalobacterium alkalinitrilicum TaxID=427920 RepID=UPI0009949D51|nr:hypothetical protein [Alkalihalobacterium alkalinitrilicum]
MRYEYQPFQLQSWIKQEKLKNIQLRDRRWDQKKFEGRLEKIKRNFQALQQAEGNFQEWVGTLTKKEKMLLPYSYENELEEKWRSHLLRHVYGIAKDERRIFRVMVDVLYRTCDLDSIQPTIKFSYDHHRERLERKMTPEQKRLWRDFLLSKQPKQQMANEANRQDQSIVKFLENYYLTENQPFFKEVLLEILKDANEDFFIKEKEIYKKFFNEGTSKDRQWMVDRLIHQCRLNYVKDLGLLIYEKMKTYRRKPMLWKEVGDEEKRRFRQWILQREIKDFFGNVNQNHERFKYWSKFLFLLEDVVITDNRKTLIMYFPDVVVMEVLGAGAVYVYSPSTFERHFQPMIDKMLAEKEKYENSWIEPKEVKRSLLMDKNLIIRGGWLSHNAGWQFKFDAWLKTNLGWEVNRRVLSQKEAERDEGQLDS